jgi:beta-galactosidase GanA
LLGLIDNKFIIGRDVFVPLSAEIHYFRVPKKYWSICFERIKKAGFRIISTFVPWNLHEERPGEFDFQGFDNPYKDLIVFLELAREFGFKIILRPGPWIKAEWPGGGLPSYLFADESLIARDSNSSLLTAKNSGGVKSGYQPSYLHPKYLNYIKRYIGGLVEAIQNYIFPKGPVFLVQLDNEINFGSNVGLFEADYNSYVVSELYPAFLEEKYETIKNLPSCYGKAKDFRNITPPVELILKKTEQFALYFDWLEFKGKMLRDYVNFLKERWESLGVGCMFSVNMPASLDFAIPIPWEEIRGEKTILGVSIDYSDNINQITGKLRLVKSLTGYSWSSQLATGASQESDRQPQAIDYSYQRLLLISSLAAGLKGINFYMFVGRDHWAGSPLDRDGTVSETYDDIRKLNVAFSAMDLSSTESFAPVAIGLYKPYQWYGRLTSAGEFAYINDLLKQTFANIQSDFSRLNYDYTFHDLDNLKDDCRPEDFSNAKILFVPSADYMSDHLQKKLADLINAGMIIVFVGLLPRFNIDFKASKVLAKNLGIQTKASSGSAHITTDNYSFKSLIYGYFQNKGTAKAIAKAGTKTVGIWKKLGKGKYYFFTYDFAANGEPGRLSLLKDILKENNIVTPVSCSEPDVDVIVRTNDRGAALFIINTGSSHFLDNITKKVVIAIDLSMIGFHQAKVTLHDVFDPESKLQTTSLELRDGLIFELGYHDARIYWIPKK